MYEEALVKPAFRGFMHVVPEHAVHIEGSFLCLAQASEDCKRVFRNVPLFSSGQLIYS